MMDDCNDDDDLQSTRYVTDMDSDHDSLDERIESEQRLRNHQLWSSFQNAASCITKLYTDKQQQQQQQQSAAISFNLSSWDSFQNAASNMATLYKDCIDSQKKFAKIGYQAGKRRKMRELNKLLKKHKIPAKLVQIFAASDDNYNSNINSCDHNSASGGNSSIIENSNLRQQSNSISTNVNNFPINNNYDTSILNVNQLNLDCNGSTSFSSANFTQAKPSDQQFINQPLPNQLNYDNQQISSSNNNSNNEVDDLVTFQQALAQPIINRANNKSSHQTLRRSCFTSPSHLSNARNFGSPATIEHSVKTEEERLLELNQFLTEEYHRHVGSKKRSCSNLGGDAIKRFRE